MLRVHADGSMAMVRGDTGLLTISVTIQDENGAIVEYEPQENDLVEFMVKKKATDEEPLIYKTGTSIEIYPEDTKDLNFGNYVYDAQITYGDSGRVDTILEKNIFEIREDVTWRK